MLLATALPSGFANHHLPSRTLVRKQQTGPKVPRAFHQLLMERKQLCDTQIRIAWGCGAYVRRGPVGVYPAFDVDTGQDAT